ncbi:hypothetical protein OS493_018675 [Desmophyllum pertusum]|uniref:Uncharacterized protein n=1 Tax=Desmophyllum pertusum TaxID=174260 RepID=A0A9X0D397_9CNID|nr:hypothetical protein OS493_018675 [Desmophyllum pertusum]
MFPIVRNAELVRTRAKRGCVVVNVFHSEQDAWSDMSCPVICCVDLEVVRIFLLVVEWFIHSYVPSGVDAPVIHFVTICDPVLQCDATLWLWA